MGKGRAENQKDLRQPVSSKTAYHSEIIADRALIDAEHEMLESAAPWIHLAITSNPNLDFRLCKFYFRDAWIASALLTATNLKGIPALLQVPLFPNTLYTTHVSKELNPNTKLDEKDMMTAFVHALKDQKEKIHVIPFPNGVGDMQPFYWEGYKTLVRYTYHLDLSLPMEVLESELDGKLRTAIRKSQAQISELEQKDIAKAMEYISNEKGLSGKQKGQISVMFENCLNHASVRALVAHENGVLVGAGMFVDIDGKRTYLLGGYDKALSSNAGPALLWFAIQEAKGKGLSIFDFEGSMIPTVERFFRRFGGELTPYYVIAKAPKALEAVLKLKMPELF